MFAWFRYFGWRPGTRSAQQGSPSTDGNSLSAGSIDYRNPGLLPSARSPGTDAAPPAAALEQGTFGFDRIDPFGLAFSDTQDGPLVPADVTIAELAFGSPDVAPPPAGPSAAMPDKPPEEDDGLGLRDPDFAERLVESGLFDAAWYRKRYQDVAQAGVDPLQHFLQTGMAEDRWPNFLFDPQWYRRTQLGGRTAADHPVVHYLRVGEDRGLKPSIYFDPVWYRRRYLAAFDTVSALGHYLLSRDSSHSDPSPHFDTAFYLRQNPDVGSSGRDPFEHFLTVGYAEGRNPSPHFNVRFYQRRYLGGAETNPLLHYLETGAAAGNNPDPDNHPTAATEIQRFTRPGKEFEELRTDLAAERPRLAKLIAFYLPQFHAFAENDAWWGPGFTEWTNLARGTPRFRGHYQPRIPRDLGFYNLDDPTVMERQIALARAAGLHGFCFYYYNFNGKRLLHQPVERFLDNTELDWPFCIIWANENWSRRWDGSEAEILIRQDYRHEDAEALIDDWARHFKDKRYIRIGGRPLFFVYRTGIVPEPRRTLAHWRELLRERHGEDPLFFIAQTFTDEDPRAFGFDGAVEFPPHKLLANVNPSNSRLEYFDHAFSGLVYQYDELVAASGSVPAPEFPLVKTVVPSWDNDARRQGRGVIIANATPDRYKSWLRKSIDFARAHPVFGEQMVFINAWNEWAEGAYLEPDLHFGSAYLNATARAVCRQAERQPLLIVTAEWSAGEVREEIAGFSATARQRFGCDLHLVRLGGSAASGELADFASVATVAGEQELADTLARLSDAGVEAAILFGTASGHVVPTLKEHGLRVVAVVDDLPRTIAVNRMRDKAHAIARHADAVVSPSASVLARFANEFGPTAGTLSVLPPVAAEAARASSAARARALASLGLRAATRLVVNYGPATIQAGVDLFAVIARDVIAQRSDVAFVWFGDIEPTLRTWLEAGDDDGRLLFRPADTLANPSGIADVVAFTARESGYAKPVAEALAMAVPVVAFDGSGTGADLATGAESGRLAPLGDVSGFAERVVELLDRAPPRFLLPRRADRKTDPATDSAFALLRQTDPALRAVSIVIPAEGEPAAVEAALATAFDQSYPVFEVVVVSDSLAQHDRQRLQDVASRLHRKVTFREGQAVGASLPQLLSAAAALAAGDLVCTLAPGNAAPSSLVRQLVHHFADDDIFAVLPCATDDAEALAEPGKWTPAELAADLRDRQDRAAEFAFGMWRRSALLAGSAGSARSMAAFLDRLTPDGGSVLVVDAASLEPERPPEPLATPIATQSRPRGKAARAKARAANAREQRADRTWLAAAVRRHPVRRQTAPGKDKS